MAAQRIRIEQTMPEIHVDLTGAPTSTQPAVVTACVIYCDDSTSPLSSPGVNAIQMCGPTRPPAARRLPRPRHVWHGSP